MAGWNQSASRFLLEKFVDLMVYFPHLNFIRILLFMESMLHGKGRDEKRKDKSHLQGCCIPHLPGSSISREFSLYFPHYASFELLESRSAQLVAIYQPPHPGRVNLRRIRQYE